MSLVKSIKKTLEKDTPVAKITIKLPLRHYKRLIALQNKAGGKLEDIPRNALRIYEYLVNEVVSGTQYFEKKRGGKKVRPVTFIEMK